ncbi:TPR repeat protein [Neisseria sp. HSC-16F19]|nr:tetratricopeptide repeat protein [Neisseria sp. HSC-16F19]MCP2040389.1 TPR repeat protein [Neisseria sp. HSC-16F19]
MNPPHDKNVRRSSLNMAALLVAAALSACAHAPAQKNQTAANKASEVKTANSSAAQTPIVIPRVEKADLEKAERGDANAQFYLGQVASMYGHHDFAKRWFEKAAAQNHADAQFALGTLYYRGIGVQQNRPLAYQWFQKAAAGNYAEAQAVLGEMYFKEKNYREARRWYGKAAAQNHTGAQINLGTMYYTGIGAPRNYALARQWFEKAAAKNDPGAQIKLAFLYWKGHGVPQNTQTARSWLEKAAARGNADAVRFLDEIGRH